MRLAKPLVSLGSLSRVHLLVSSDAMHGIDCLEVKRRVRRPLFLGVAFAGEAN